MSIEVGQVEMVQLESIVIEERAREELGDLTGIEESLKSVGLISPLAVKRLDNGKFKLLAGERRFSVLQKNKVEQVPVRVYPEGLSEIEISTIELSENFYRKDFEYWEHDNLVRKIHELRQQAHGAKAPGPDAQGWGTADTGKLIGTTKASVSTAIKRSETREAFPELFEKSPCQ